MVDRVVTPTIGPRQSSQQEKALTVHWLEGIESAGGPYNLELKSLWVRRLWTQNRFFACRLEILSTVRKSMSNCTTTIHSVHSTSRSTRRYVIIWLD